MKKFISLIMAVVMTLSLSVVSFAAPVNKVATGKTIQIGDYYFTINEIKEGPITRDARGFDTKSYDVQGGISDKNYNGIATVRFHGQVGQKLLSDEWVFWTISTDHNIINPICSDIGFERGEVGKSTLKVTVAILFASGNVERPAVLLSVDSNGNVDGEWI